eukprot:5994246-Alexandrium_andersonii.AAC.1
MLPGWLSALQKPSTKTWWPKASQMVWLSLASSRPQEARTFPATHGTGLRGWNGDSPDYSE